MTRLNKILLALVVAQFALATVMLTRDDDVALARMQPVLAGFDSATVTRLQVFDKNAETAAVDLVKAGDAWKLASAFDHPADATKVGDLLAKLAAMNSRGPIATTAPRHQQLGVADKAFEKKLVVTTPAGDTTIFVGAQSEGRTTPVRIATSAKVYGVTGVTPWAIDADPGRWIDTRYLVLDKDQIAKLEVATPAGATGLERTATGWQLVAGGQPVALAAGEALDATKVETLVGHVASIKVFAPGDPKKDASTPTATVSVWLAPVDPSAPGASQEERLPDHVLDVVADGDNYWVRDRSRPVAGMIGKGSLQDVVELSRDKLVTKPSTPAPPTEAGNPTRPKPPSP